MKPEEALEVVAGYEGRLNRRGNRATALRIVLAMAKAAQGMAKALESVEHPVTPEGNDMGQCASCGRSEIRDHAAFCRVGCALAEFRKASGGDAP